MSDNLLLKRAKTPEDIFARMHRELRAWNPRIPESVERLDPVIRIMMQMYAQQLSQIDGRLDEVWEVASNSLIRSLCPESLRWPIPAFTVMKGEISDPVVEIDEHTKYFYKEKREGGQTFFFSGLRPEKLVDATLKHTFFAVDDSLVDLSPQSGDVSSTAQPRVALAPGDNYQIYFGIEFSGAANDMAGSAIYLAGDKDVLNQIRWAKWYPGATQGEFYADEGFCPGLSSSVEEMFATERAKTDWGGLRTSANLFSSLESNFIIVPEAFASTWERSTPSGRLQKLLLGNNITLPEDSKNLYWIRLDLPSGGDKRKLQSSFELYFNCFVVVNKNELTLFKHTGGNRLVEVELPEELSDILEINSVVDSSGREYRPRHEAVASRSGRYYSPEEKSNRMVLWFDFSDTLELPPDSLTINYSVTSCVSANGIEAGRINELYESHPGVTAVVNITPVGGAVPAKKTDQITAEISARLRNRDRALSFDEISRWCLTYDPRIRSAVCQNGVARGQTGIHRCLVAKIIIDRKEFYSDEEIDLLTQRLTGFLKSRAPVNTQFRVEIGE